MFQELLVDLLLADYINAAYNARDYALLL